MAAPAGFTVVTTTRINAVRVPNAMMTASGAPTLRTFRGRTGATGPMGLVGRTEKDTTAG